MSADVFISRFTPSMMSADVLEKVFVQRGQVADRITEVVRESILTPAKHHTLVIGARGIGKTHLLALVHNRISRQEEVAERARIAWLREEEWGVASFLDFLYRILRALAARYADETLREQTESLFSLPLKTAERRAADLLREFLQGSTLLLIAENLDSIFGGLGKKGQQRLRACLQEESSWTILGSSQALFGGVTLYDSPFYGFFDIQHLQELTVDDAAQLIRNLAELANDAELASYVQSDSGRARIRAVHHLAGGNHRVYMILSEFLTRKSLDQLVDPFLRMMDDLTPYYQSRMEQLSPQQRKIIDLLCSVRGAVPVKEIAKRCFITPQTTSSQLKDLRERGYVESTPVGRDAYYELTEPLMRLALEVKNQRDGHVRLFLDFLRHWYARDELSAQLARTPATSLLEREYLQRALEAQEDDSTPALQRLVVQMSEHLGREWETALHIAEKLVEQRGSVSDWASLGMCLTSLSRFEEALPVLERTLDKDRAYAPAWVIRSVALLGLDRHDEAVSAVERVIHIDNTANAYALYAMVLERADRIEDAVRASRRSVELAPDLADAWERHAELLGRTGPPEEAVAASEAALANGASSLRSKVLHGKLLNRVGRFEESAMLLRDLVQEESTSIDVAGEFLFALTGLRRYNEVLERSSKLLTSVLESSDRDGLLPLSFMLACSLRFMQPEAVEQRSKARQVYDIYAAHEATGVLGVGVLFSGAGFPEAATPSSRWLELWGEIANSDEHFRLPLRLLAVLLKYHVAEDPRLIMELPAEERRVVQDLLNDPETISEDVRRFFKPLLQGQPQEVTGGNR